MNKKLLCFLLVSLLALPLMAAPPKGKMGYTTSQQIDNTTFINANRILSFVTNHGNIGRDLAGVFGYDYGTFFPYTSVEDIQGNVNAAGDNSPNYAMGLWIGGIDSATGEIRVIISEYSSEYVPGPMEGGTFLPDRSDFKVYKLYGDSLADNPNADYTNWPVEQGAPVDDMGNPDVIGDQMLWCVFNDADPDGHSNDAGDTNPLGLEVKQTVFAFNREGSLGNIIFMRYRIYNKGGNTLQNCFFSIWDDPDLGSAGDDLVGCDTLLGLGFVYNADNEDPQYEVLPCMGIDFFQGPLRARTAADTTVDGEPLPIGRMWGQTYEDSVNIGMISFNKYINGTDPDDFGETYAYMRGLDAKTNEPYVYEGDTLLFQKSGDPVEGTGDLDDAPADRRWMQTTGPVTFRPGDSTEILCALIVGLGSDRLSSITVMKTLDNFAQRLYEDGFNPPKPPAAPDVTIGESENMIALSWTDASELEPGDFEFEGYSVWQGASSAGPWTLLQTYDVVNHRAGALVDTVADTESGLNMPVIRRVIKNVGLDYSFVTENDALMGGVLNNYSDYFFRVTAFSFSDTLLNGDGVPAGDRFLESATVLKVVPQAAIAGTTPQTDPEDVLDVDHPAGLSQGVITPLIMDPLALTGHTYRVTFEEVFDTVVDDHVPPETTVVSSIVWNLDDATTNTRLLSQQANQTGDEAYFTVDGIKLKVAGPAPGFLNFAVTANASGALDPWVPGALHFRDFPTPGDANPGDDQQVGDGHWGIHTADNGGSNGGGTRGTWDAFLARTLRDGGNSESLGAWDYEMRFTGDITNPDVDGSYAIEAFNDDNVFWVPFELWQTGIGTPADPSDDIRLVPLIIDDWGLSNEGDNAYELESWGLDGATCSGDCEHSASGGDDDPWTDWVYWYEPTDMSPGTAGYDANEADMIAGSYDYSLINNEIMARTVLINWNGGVEPPFTQDCPEMGTIFRIETAKPNAATDTFTFVAPAPVLTSAESDLDNIKAVPNPFYLNGPYDPTPGSYELRFHHLPEVCTINIYNLGGDLVRTLDKDDPSPIATWDLLTENGLPLASGIYIYVVDAEGFGQKIGKVAIFTEAEVLRIF